jgi:hypothetical protein
MVTKLISKILFTLSLIIVPVFVMADNSVKNEHSALYEHINFFADPKTGDVTIESIKKKLVSFRIPEDKAELQALLIGTFNQSVFSYNTKGCPFSTMNPSKHGVSAMYHAGTSRINKADGTLDLKRLERLKNAFSENYNGKKIITKNNLDAFLKECRELDEKNSGDPRTNDPIEIGQTAIDAAWNVWFELFTSGWKEINNNPKEFEAYVTTEQVDQFFKNPQAAWMTVVNNEVPVPKPQ